MKKLFLAALLFVSVSAIAQPSVGSTQKTTKQKGTDAGLYVRPLPQDIMRMTFSKVISGDWDSDYWTDMHIGSGMTLNQSAGNGTIATGTTANSETILRSSRAFYGSFNLRTQIILSQRIANNNFFVELVDVIGDGLTITISSAVAVTVTFPSGHGFTSQNVGQSMYLGNYTGTGTFVPGRYAIASVSGDNITFTVAGFAAGSGTCSAFGWNYMQTLYSGTTATSATWDCQRKGWASGASTITVTTTATGHILHNGADDGFAYVADQLVASAASMNITQRASRVVNIPDEATPLYIQIRAVNGTTSPASTTTLTVGSVSMESFAPATVNVVNNKGINRMGASPVVIDGTPAVTVSSGTITTVTTTSTLSGGPTAASSASANNPVQVGGVVVPITAATQDQTFAAGDVVKFPMTTGAQVPVKLYSTAEVDWQYAAASGGIVSTTTAVTIKAAANAGIRNYITAIQIAADGAGTATELAVRDGAAGTVIWRLHIPAAGFAHPQTFTFPTPLRGTANTLFEVVTLTSSASPVYFNAQGYTGF